jgi:lambda repressor-like predicted transcriptional regulator
MKPEEIKAELVRRKISVSEIAQRDGCSVVQVTRCIKGDGLYARTRETIADAIEMPVEKVFTKDHPKPKRRVKAVISTA